MLPSAVKANLPRVEVISLLSKKSRQDTHRVRCYGPEGKARGSRGSKTACTLGARVFHRKTFQLLLGSLPESTSEPLDPVSAFPRWLLRCALLICLPTSIVR